MIDRTEQFGLCLVVPAKSKVKTTQDLFGKAIGIFDDDAAAEDVQKLVKGYTKMMVKVTPKA